jgi:Lon protease-like protein
MVLFPGASAPLLIFEPRYRRMLADCLQGDHRFGLICLPAGMAERDLTAGRVGTIALIDAAETLPDGRSKIAITGEDRFAFERYVESDTPYHVAATTQYDDFPEPNGELDEAAEQLQEQFERVARAARTLADDAAPPPALPDDPSGLAFAIAAMVDLTTDQRQKLLESRSPLERMRDVGAILDVAAVPMERYAEVHRRARQNGRGTLEAT